MKSETNVCKKCSFENESAARFCQGCGAKLPQKRSAKEFLDSLDLKDVAGIGTRGLSIAPMAGRVIEDQGKEVAQPGVRQADKARVVPLPDGKWFCPDCGELNKVESRSCQSCGRYK